MTYFIRIVVFAFMLSNYIANLCTHDAHDLSYFAIYLTNWGITLLTLWTALDAIVAVTEFVKQRRSPGYKLT